MYICHRTFMNFIIRFISICVFVSLLITIDVYTKHLAVTHLVDGSTRNYLWGFIKLIYAENSGGMLGFGDQLPEAIRFLLFEVAVGLVIAVLFFYCTFKTGISAVKTTSYMLIISGGLGNLIDRIFNEGNVIDFLLLSLGEIHTGIFNFADVYLTTGVSLILILSFINRKQIPQDDAKFR